MLIRNGTIASSARFDYPCTKAKLVRYDDENNRFFTFVHNGYDTDLLALNVSVQGLSISVNYIDSSSNVVSWGYALTSDAVYLVHVST